MVQAFNGRVLGDAALSRGPRGSELSTGSGESLGGFGQSRSASRPEPGSSPVEQEQLAAQPFDPMPCLRTGVFELAAVARASRERECGDDNDEHHRYQHHRGHEYCGHALDGTRQTAVAVPSPAPAILIKESRSEGDGRAGTWRSAARGWALIE